MRCHAAFTLPPLPPDCLNEAFNKEAGSGCVSELSSVRNVNIAHLSPSLNRRHTWKQKQFIFVWIFFIHAYLRFAFTAAWLYVLLLVVFLTRTYLTEYLLECYKEPFYDLYIEVSSIINILPDSFVQIRWSILLSTVIVCYLFDNVFYLHTTCCKNVLSGKDDI